MTNAARDKLAEVYQALFKRLGPQNWWPADDPFEVCVGAILTQSTSWSNVEKAIQNLKREGLLDVYKLDDADVEYLAGLIKASLYYNVKARKLKEFTGFLIREYEGEVERMKKVECETLRRQLLSIWGVGPETADSILLYAIGKPSFVVDAYTRRLFSRMGLLRADQKYDEVKSLFESSIPADTRTYNEYHALIVEHAKRVCRKRPRCVDCCLSKFCERLI